MPKVHVLTNRSQIDPQRLARAVAVVVDVVFGTTVIAIALERGARDVLVMSDAHSARSAAGGLAPGEWVLAGEQGGLAIPGFVEPWPHALLSVGLTAKHLVYVTTNGTVALRMAASASLVLAGALVNATAVARHVCAVHAGLDVVLVCAGTGAGFSLEDFYGAGYLASLLGRSGIDFQLTDAAQAARLLYERGGAIDWLEQTHAGRMAADLGLVADLELCARNSIFTAVPVFCDGRITRA